MAFKKVLQSVYCYLLKEDVNLSFFEKTVATHLSVTRHQVNNTASAMVDGNSGFCNR